VPQSRLLVTLEMQQEKLDRYKSMVFDRKTKTQYN
jgi:hypothetical protein